MTLIKKVLRMVFLAFYIVIVIVPIVIYTAIRWVIMKVLFKIGIMKRNPGRYMDSLPTWGRY